MKKFLIGVLFAVVAVSIVQFAQAEDPVARLSQGTAIVAIGDTSGVDTQWLNTGNTDSTVLTGQSMKTGAGIVRAVMYTAPAGVTNGVITFYAYDGQVKYSVYANSASVTSGASAVTGRYNLLSTNIVYSGRLRVEVSQAVADVDKTWRWGVILE